MAGEGVGISKTADIFSKNFNLVNVRHSVKYQYFDLDFFCKNPNFDITDWFYEKNIWS